MLLMETKERENQTGSEGKTQEVGRGSGEVISNISHPACLISFTNLTATSVHLQRANTHTVPLLSFPVCVSCFTWLNEQCVNHLMGPKDVSTELHWIHTHLHSSLTLHLNEHWVNHLMRPKDVSTELNTHTHTGTFSLDIFPLLKPLRIPFPVISQNQIYFFSTLGNVH